MAKGKKTKKDKGGDGTTLIASYKRAYRDYDILDTYEAGLVLTGSEVKSLREGNAQIAEGYARVQRGEMWLDGIHIRIRTPSVSEPTIPTGLASSCSTGRRSTSSTNARHRVA